MTYPDTDHPPPFSPTLVSSTLQTQAESESSRLAVVDEVAGTELTYGDLTMQASRLRNLLLERGVGP